MKQLLLLALVTLAFVGCNNTDNGVVQVTWGDGSGTQTYTDNVVANNMLFSNTEQYTYGSNGSQGTGTVTCIVTNQSANYIYSCDVQLQVWNDYNPVDISSTLHIQNLMPGQSVSLGSLATHIAINNGNMHIIVTNLFQQSLTSNG